MNANAEKVGMPVPRSLSRCRGFGRKQLGLEEIVVNMDADAKELAAKVRILMLELELELGCRCQEYDVGNTVSTRRS